MLLKKIQKIDERKDREKDFKVLLEAKEKLNRENKKKEFEYIIDEREKSLSKQKELSEKQEIKRIEREEKRRNFIENIEATKKIKEDENFRLDKERIYENNSKISGIKDLSFRLNLTQRISLGKTLKLFND